VTRRAKSEPKPERICPRCGQPYNWLETKTMHGRRYLFAIHVTDGVRKSCYLGPVGGYKIGAKTHPYLRLTGFGANPREEFERRMKYLDESVQGLLKLASTEEDRRRVLEALDRAISVFKGESPAPSLNSGGPDSAP
jgi:hypothetical protein